MEILTIDEVAALLKMKRNQIYTMTRKRAQENMEVPLPVLRINGNLRFRKSDVESWLQQLAVGNEQPRP